ncbi:MAG: hypothetical protein JJLCMIEE_01122 [Acidimicrobiales bacterium]|nr:hypothetical protein [Acidimicrobiales bacterium]
MALSPQATSSAPGRPAGWLRIGELAHEAGVTKATIHHYVKIGILPRPIKTNERMAYYDPACVERLHRVRELRERRYMPLPAIKELLDRHGEQSLGLVDAAVLAPFRQRDRHSRADLLEACPVGEHIFDALVESGLLSPEPDGTFTADDAEVLSCVHAMIEAGLGNDESFDPDELSTYVKAMDALVRDEFAMFNAHFLGRSDPDDVARLAREGIRFVSQMLCALHRRRLLIRLEEVTRMEEPDGT